MDIAHTHSRKV